jgi:hypothetical protein
MTTNGPHVIPQYQAKESTKPKTARRIMFLQAPAPKTSLQVRSVISTFFNQGQYPREKKDTTQSSAAIVREDTPASSPKATCDAM